MGRKRIRKLYAGILVCLLAAFLVGNAGIKTVLAAGFGTVTGTVTENGVPLAGAKVLFPGGVIVYTDSEGHYTQQVQEGSAMIRCYAPDGAYIGLQTVFVIAGETVVVDFDFTPGTVTGTVTENGVPLAGAFVALVYPAAVIVYTDSEGHYTLRVQAGSVTLHCYAPDSTYIGAQTVTVMAGETLIVDFDFTPGTVTGTVTENGVPLAGAKVIVQPGGATVYTDSEGHYTLRVQAGSARALYCYAPDMAAYIGEQIVTVIAGETVVVDFDFTPGTVTGTVTENGVPLAGAKVIVQPGGATVYTDSEGHYTLQVQAGTVALYCYAPDGAYIGAQGVTVIAGETVVVDFPEKYVPVAVAEPGLDEDDNLILDGSKSSDVDGTIVSYDWSLINRDPEGNNFALTGEKASTETVDIGVYDVILTVVDNDGLTDMDTMVLAVPLAIPDWLFDGLNEIETLIGTPQGRRKSTSDYPEGALGNQLDSIIDMLLAPPGQSIKKNAPHGK